MTDLYEILGVARDADADTIKKAFRKLAQQHHPDKGGDHAKMQEVQQAYDVLGDAERRRQYDETGSTAPISSVDDKARSALAEMINKAVEAVGTVGEDALEFHDPVQVVRDELHSVREANAEVRDKTQRKIRQRQTALKRLVRKEGEGPSILADALRGAIVQLENAIEQIAEKDVVILKILDMLAEYDYHTDERKTPRWEPMSSGGWSSMPGPSWGSL